MEREQTKAIIKYIKDVYQNRFVIENPGQMVGAWHRVLQRHDYEQVMANLEVYIENNKFAPTVADIIKPPKVERDRYIPNTEETRKYLEEQDKIREQVKNDPKVQKAKAEARAEIMKMLGRG